MVTSPDRNPKMCVYSIDTERERERHTHTQREREREREREIYIYISVCIFGRSQVAWLQNYITVQVYALAVRCSHCFYAFLRVEG